MVKQQNFDSLRSSTLAHGSSAPVSVNQRHLIDKVLARYSSPGAVYRELLQNSNDAGAVNAELYFSVNGDGNVTNVRYRNDGEIFGKNDWERLARIAEGNPNEGKVGAFGVGFYSVFSITENPMVVSGEIVMVFHWRGDGLVVTKSTVENDGNEDDTKWTEFIFPVREQFPAPDLKKFSSFLSSSLTFTTSLMNVTVFINDVINVRVKKIREDAFPVKMAVTNSLFRTNLNLCSPSIFKIEKKGSSLSITETPITVIADFPSSKEIYQVQSRIISANIHARPSSNLSNEILRVMKKPPQRHIELHLVLGDHDGDTDSGILSNFSPASGRGLIFIGFPTRQTSGFGVHIASNQLFPAVDRDTVDLSSGHAIATWNQEVLYIAGVTLRIILESSLARLAQEFLQEPKVSSITDEVKKPEAKSSVRRFFSHAAGMLGFKKDALLYPDEGKLSRTERRALTLLNACAAHDSTPSGIVQQFISNGLLAAMPHHKLPILTATGLSREPLKGAFGIEQFCVNTPVVKKQIIEGAPKFMAMCSPLRDLSVGDLVRDLDGRILELDKAVKLIKWWPRYCAARQNLSNDQVRSQDGEMLKNAISVKIRGKDVALSPFRFFAGSNITTHDVPLPPACLSPEIQRHIDIEILQQSFFHELPPLRWCVWASEHASLSSQESPLRKKIFNAIAELYANDSTLSSHKKDVIKTLCSRQCVDTKGGTLEFPEDCYLPEDSVVLFKPIRSKLVATWLESPRASSLLKDLGVRDHVSIDVLFSSLDSLDYAEDASPLVRYLLTVENRLSQDEWQQLREAKYLPSVGNEGLYAPSELVFFYERQPALPGTRYLRWKGRRDADEERLLRKLGVRERARLEDILKDGEPASAELLRAISSDRIYVDSIQNSKARFLPCVREGQEVVCSVSECFVNSQWSALQLATVAQDIRREALSLGVREHPTINSAVFALLKLVSQLKAQSSGVGQDQDKIMDEAFAAMGALSEGLTDKKVRTVLANAPIVLIRKVWYRPADVYFQKSKSSLFPRAKECVFLRVLGVRDFPTARDIAIVILQNPQGVFERIGDEEYLGHLRTIANDFENIEDRMKKQMRRMRWLVGFRKKGLVEERKLVKIGDVVLIDNTLLTQFECWGCPLENGLEKMYQVLGCMKLSAKVRKQRRVFGKERHTSFSESMKTRLLERRGILLDRDLRLAEGEKLLSEKMDVVQVDKIILVLRFEDESRDSEVCCALDASSGRLKLQITDNIDYFEIADALGDALYEKFRFEERFYIGMILEMSVEQLRKRGLPVDRRIVGIPERLGCDNAERAMNDESQSEQLNESTPLITTDNSPPLRVHEEFNKETRKLPYERPPSPRAPREAMVRPNDDKTRGSVHANAKRPSKGGMLERALRTLKGSGTVKPPTLSKLPTGTRSEYTYQQRTSSGSDLEQQARTKKILQQAIESCAKVSSMGFKSRERHVQQALAREAHYSCEVIPSQDLSPLQGPNGSAKTKNFQIRTFVSRQDERAEKYIKRNWQAVETFGSLLNLLAGVFGVPLKSCAIFYDPSGRTIAFNFNGSLFFNVRFFINLHGGDLSTLRDPDVYVYWYLTFAHELAHQIESHHNQTHSYLMTSFIESYFLKFVRILHAQGISVL